MPGTLQTLFVLALAGELPQEVYGIVAVIAAVALLVFLFKPRGAR